MGAVYLAVDEILGSEVAVKVTLAASEELRQAFYREAVLLSRLQHPALPDVKDYFTDGDVQFLVMQYIRGDDLHRQLARRQSALPVSTVLRWADELLDTLEYLHAFEPPVIHRDIKPQNLKLTPQGHVMLLDFGLSKGLLTVPGGHEHARSVHGYTLNFAPLEQIEGRVTGPRSDLFSLAATLYLLMTGHLPPTAVARGLRLMEKKPDPLVWARELNRQIPQAVATQLHLALSLEIEQRPESATAMRRALAAASREVVPEFEESVPGTPERDERYASPTRPPSIPSVSERVPSSAVSGELLSLELAPSSQARSETRGQEQGERSRWRRILGRALETGRLRRMTRSFSPRRMKIATMVMGLVGLIGVFILGGRYFVNPEEDSQSQASGCSGPLRIETQKPDREDGKQSKQFDWSAQDVRLMATPDWQILSANSQKFVVALPSSPGVMAEIYVTKDRGVNSPYGSLLFIFTAGKQKLNAGELRGFMWLAVDGHQGVLYQGAPPGKPDAVQRLEWYSFRVHQGQLQSIKVTFAAPSATYAQHETMFLSMLRSVQFAIEAVAGSGTDSRPKTAGPDDPYRSMSWPQQGIQWDGEGSWYVGEVDKDSVLLNLVDAPHVAAIATVVDFPALREDAYLQREYDYGLDMLKNRVVDDVRWMTLAGIKGVFAREIAPLEPNTVRTMDWVGCRQLFPGCQRIHIILCARAKEFPHLETKLMALLGSTRID